MMMKSAIHITGVQVFGNVCALLMTEEGLPCGIITKKKGKRGQPNWIKLF